MHSNELHNVSAGVLYILVLFFAVLCKTTPRNDQFQGFIENGKAGR